MKAAIFDMDGTLVDSMPYWRGHMKSYLDEFGLEITQEDVERLINHSGSFKYLYDRIKIVDDSITWDELTTNYHNRMRPEYRNNILLKPYSLDYIKSLQEKGIPMCIATATPRDLFMPMIERLDLEQYFDFFITVEEVGVRKSEPDIYNYCADKFGLDQKECVVFEDTIQAITTASNAGFYTVGVSDPASSWAEDRIRQVSQRFITSYKELL